MTSEVRLFRKPRRPKLEKLELNKKDNSFSEDDILNATLSETNSTLSTDREIINPNYINAFRLPNISGQNSKSKLVAAAEDNNIPMPKNSFKTMSASSISSITESSVDTVFNERPPKYRPNMRTIMSSVYHNRNSVQQRKSILSVLKPSRITGPDPLPQRPLKFHNFDLIEKKNFYENLTYENDYLDPIEVRRQNENNFKLNDFFAKENYNPNLVDFCYEKVCVSSYNYIKLSNLLSERIQLENFPNRGQLNVQTLVPDIEPVEMNRKPFRQAMIEMASYLKNELSQKTGANLKARLNPVSSWQKKSGTQTEIVLYEDTEEKKEPKDEEEISASQIAVIDSLLRNGLALSLKAHFIDTLPDLSSLRNTLVYINLSFNNFKDFPPELLEFTQLEAIKLRSNPIRYLPEKFGNFQNLKILSLAYCLLKEMPSCIFELQSLIDLDLSYNQLNHLDQNILQLVSLKTLNMEGNELEVVPCCMLKMKNLEILNVKNNYLHPLIWRCKMANKVQRLFDMSAVVFEKNFGEMSQKFQQLSFEVQQKIEKNFYRCDICDGKRFGDGLKLIKPCEKIFGVRFLPFLFISCSLECLNQFKAKTYLI
ncbi:leucine-rich repeat-containing 63 isoform X1 [Brachionus plicatilis]|uniref:Leucine-rich repeat-containing 63 isoform X1 n=1 Tax=Brachionus plicatilis TaxID=10195 RepID=A0A3M7STA0_BRAPC|nr:leucine-rich repeat-containing 63 isoform X1 [Brachionus plicatilis]